MEYIDKPVCDSCGCLEFEFADIEKPQPETRYVQASQFYKLVDYSTSNSAWGLCNPEPMKKATCKKCGREYLY